MNVRVEFLDGVVRDYEGEVQRDEDCLVVRKTEHYGATPKISVIIPLYKVREVKYA